MAPAGTCGSNACGDDRLPVYRVVTTGVTDAEAHHLADALKIPGSEAILRDGEMTFFDRDRYLAVPTVTIQEPQIVDRFLKGTTNHHPEIPIEIQGIDYEALERHVPFPAQDALTSAVGALEAAGLTPAQARPIVGHTELTTVRLRATTADGAEGGEDVERQTLLDTYVKYRFTLDGYPLIGPGAQIQLSFGAEGNLTRLIHASRTLQPGALVSVADPEEIRARLACGLPDGAEVDLRVVYLAPSLRSALAAGPGWRPSELIPWYAVTVTRPVVNPSTGKEERISSRTRLVPATEDTRFVPSVSIEAAVGDAAEGRSRVEARARVVGGTPPYSFLWAGSSPETSAHRGPETSYQPVTRDLREIIPTQSLRRTENLAVTVLDANGVAAQAVTSLPVIAQPAPGTHNSVTYGCESPDDPGAWSGDRIAWQHAMSTLGGGSERFCWMADSSWAGDFIEGPTPGALEPHPWINGDADYSNWGINTANIVFYIGDSNPNVFAEMFPGAAPSDYNTGSGASVWSPTHATTVQIGSQGYNVPYAGAWGGPHPQDRLQWLAMYACNLLESDSSAPAPWARWGPAFDGLHSLMAFHTEAGDSNDFCFDFPLDFLGLSVFVFTIPPKTIVQSWLSSAQAADIGTPAAMGPITDIDFLGQRLGIWNYGDYYWGKGPVGPTIPKSQINGWWYIKTA